MSCYRSYSTSLLFPIRIDYVRAVNRFKRTLFFSIRDVFFKPKVVPLLPDPTDSLKVSDPISYYKIRLDEFRKVDDVASILKLHFEMKKRRILSNSAGYNDMILYCFGRMKNSFGLLRHWEEMNRSRLSFDIRTYNTIIKAFSLMGDSKNTLFYFEQMKKKGPQPDAQTFFYVISSLRSDPIKIMELFDEMKSRRFIDPRTFNLVMSVFSKLGDVAQMTLLFEEMTQRRLSPDLFTYNTLLHGYATFGDEAKLLQTFEKMKMVPSLYPDIVSYNTVLKFFANIHDTYHMTFYFNEMNSFLSSKIQANLNSYTTMISTYGKLGDIKKMMDYFDKMKKKGIKPDLTLYNSLISSFSHRNDYDTVSELIDEMKSLHFKPDIRTFTSILDSLLNSNVGPARHEMDKLMATLLHSDNNSISLEDSLLRKIRSYADSLDLAKPSDHPPSTIEIIQRIFDRMKSYSVRPNAAIYNVLLKFYVKRRDIESIERTIEEMNRYSLKPDKWTFSTLINNITASNPPRIAVKRIIQIIDKMKSSGIRPTVVTYNQLLVAIGKAKDIHKVDSIFQEMLSPLSSFGPDTQTYNIVMDAYSKASLPDRVSELFKDMLRNRIRPDSVTFGTMVQTYRDTDDVLKMLDLFRTMRKSGIEPDVYMYNMVIELFGRKQEFERLEAFFKRMKYLQIIPDVVTYNTIISAYARSGNRIRVTELYNEMLSAKIEPDSKTFTTLISNTMELEIADLLEQSEQAGFKAKDTSYFSILRILGDRGETELMKEVISIMKRQGVNIDNIVAMKRVYDKNR